MSKQGKRKITVELPKTKDLANRPSVFERLGTKKSSSVKKSTDHCRQWAQHGTCAYGKNCKFAATHILISPSKQRAANKDIDKKSKDDGKNRLLSTVVVRSGRSPEGEIDNWDQNDLEYADTDVLEKRRQQLQRELEIQLKMDSGKDIRKEKKKTVSSSSSSRSSSSSSASSSSTDGSSSSSSSGRDARRKVKKNKLKRNSTSSSDNDAPSKKKQMKGDSVKRDKIDSKKTTLKKDDKLLKKSDNVKKKILPKGSLGKKSLSPGKKSGGTPPITSKSITKNTTKHSKSPVRKEKNKSVSPHSSKDRDKDRNKERDKERDRNRGRSRSPRKARSRSPRRHGSYPKDPRKKSGDRSRPISPKKQPKKDGSSDRHKKRSISRDRGREHKDRSLERRKEKHDDKERHDRKDRRDRTKDLKREDPKRRGRDRGLGRGAADKGLEKPNKPMERLLPRPEERLAALAAITNRALDSDKNSTTSKDRQDTHSDRGGRKPDRERERSSKRDRMDSMDRDQGDYEMTMDRQFDHGHSVDHYDRVGDRYDDAPRDDDRSPGYGIQSRDRRYDMPGPPRYPDDEERLYGYEDRRHRDRSWEGRSGSLDRERYMHPHKEWENEDYRAGNDWGRERHWPMHDGPQRTEWGDKEPDMEGWHHRGHPQGPNRGRAHGGNDYGRGMRVDVRSEANKRRAPRPEPEATPKEVPAAVAAALPPRQDGEADDNAIADDLSEISDDPNDILEREDMVDHTVEEESQGAPQVEETIAPKLEPVDNQSTQDTSTNIEEKESQEAKDDEDGTNLDFEEISDGELEEERTRAGLGDALGVDWASLVADVNRREQTSTSRGARDRWLPERVLTRLGISVQMAGPDTVQSILEQNAKTNAASTANEDKTQTNGTSEDGVQSDTGKTLESVHPVAAIQVAIEKRKRQRAVLFGSGSEITRALSARRDLSLRRHLCRLPGVERASHPRPQPQPDLFHKARALLMQAPVTG